MSKYIDAKKLKAEIEHQKKHLSRTHQDELGAVIAYEHILSFIESLQQEQPDVDLEKEITPSLVENMLCEFGIQSIDDMDSENLAEFARHFWNKGYNARKEN